ncbi:MAG TPA: PBP1A family penicillin-binding protein, partial [Nitrospiria bacterium]|nr:PBP1A family penicillin-binding protein [Nitrospiria bacterium]
ERLKRLGYVSSDTPPARPGTFTWSGNVVSIYFNKFEYPDSTFPATPIDIFLEGSRVSLIENSETGKQLLLAELEPELIDAFYDETWEERDLVRLEDVSPDLVDAILAMEDTRFYQHFGIDLRGIARAFIANIMAGGIVQGGSTLTQQLVKNFYLDHERTLTRKINEAFMAILLELNYEKDEILEAYLNEIYMAQSGSMGIFGVGRASRFYFGKSPSDLTLSEAALLAGMIKSPNIFSPFKNPERAARRREVVLNRMQKLEQISMEEKTSALKETILTRPPARRERLAPYFVDFVRDQLADHYTAEVLTSEGLRIFTTLDGQQQREAERTLARGLETLEKNHPRLQRENPEEGIQASLVALQPQTGQIRAMVGGRDYAVTQFNRAAHAKRQPGSLFKPFVYATALAGGETDDGQPMTAATLVDDSPFELEVNGEPWAPQNYNKEFLGPVTLRTALEKSLNVATVRLADQIGISSVIRTARAMGITSPLRDVPSLALGTSEVTPLEMAVAYTTIANGGIRVEPVAIKEVVYATGQVLERKVYKMERVLTQQQAYLLTSLLEGVVKNGTAQGVLRRGFQRPAGGKTGTTSQYNDAWFVGFTPGLLGLVWVGFDGGPETDAGNRNMGLTGAQAALPLWSAFMNKATAGHPVDKFIPPEGVVFKKIDPLTGLLANSD